MDDRFRLIVDGSRIALPRRRSVNILAKNYSM
jgi:hypothetical protein